MPSLLAWLARVNLWHFVWLAVVLAVLMSFPASALMHGRIAWDYPLSAGFISLAVASLLVFIVKRMRDIEGILDDQSLVGIYVIQDGKMAYVNAKTAQMFGYTPEEILAVPSVFDLVVEEDRPLAAENIRKRMTGERLDIRYRFRGKRKDGTIVHVEVHGARIQYKGRPAIFGVALDMTGERQAMEALQRSEEQLRQAQKMEAIGRLAGGVAHDFNNLLTIIKGNSELLLNRRDVQAPLRRYVEQIKQGGDRAAELTRQLLAFSRQQVLQAKVLDLNAIVASMRSMLERLLGEDIDLAANLDPNLGHVKADPGQLGQVIMNLVVNTRDAMPQGGKVTIETSNVEIEAPRRHDQIVRPGRYVMLSVSDNGCGMDRETQARIFEPFFTTKEQGKGTGLGLSTVYGIVKQSDGYIFVYSEVGAGTTFKIYLPRVETVAEQTGGEEAAPERLHATETVLLVEDEPGVRRVAREALIACGFTVLEARHGIEALLVAKQHPSPIHLLVTDVVMPQMNGPEVASRLASSRPAMKVLYMSGYTDHAVVHHGVIDPGFAFLQKPFSPEDLVQKVREVLRAAPIR